MSRPAAFRIPIYIPNISTEKLISLFISELGEDGSKVRFERLEKGAKFRAPDLAIIVDGDARSFQVRVIQILIASARLLGATQFAIENDGFTMRLRPTNLGMHHIERLLIASNTFTIGQINIF